MPASPRTSHSWNTQEHPAKDVNDTESWDQQQEENDINDEQEDGPEESGGASDGAGSGHSNTESTPAVITPTPGASVASVNNVADVKVPLAPPPVAAELTSNSFVNAAMKSPNAFTAKQHVTAAAASTAGNNPLAMKSTAGANVGMIVLGVGLIVGLTLISVLGVMFYRRRLRRQEAAMMFLEVGEKDLPTRPAPSAAIAGALKGKKIGDPVLVNTTAQEAMRGPGVIPAGPRSPQRSSTTGSKKSKPKLSLANYRQPSLGTNPTIVPPSPSPRYRTTPDMFADEYLSAKTPTFAPSPRRQTSFDCAPSPLPTDSRQRYGRYEYGAGESCGPVQTPAPRVVGHRRSISNANRPTVRHSRQAVYGQHQLQNRVSTASSQGGESFLSIPITSRYSFDGDEVHGMI